MEEEKKQGRTSARSMFRLLSSGKVVVADFHGKEERGEKERTRGKENQYILFARNSLGGTQKKRGKGGEKEKKEEGLSSSRSCLLSCSPRRQL